mmetsp:Transcript_7867/g.29442  ORF Transcript_7867/g.29442 Transcript_7867/m.29442 type:complete len:408 (-) Transcript_7867:1315-2538(-)
MSNHYRHHHQPSSSTPQSSSTNYQHAQDLHSEPFIPIQDRKSLVTQQKEEYFRQKRIHQLRQQVEERLRRDRNVDLERDALLVGNRDVNHEQRDGIDTTKLLGEITYSLEEKLRSSIRKEMQLEQKRERHEKRVKYSQMDQHLAEEIASKICAVCFELMKAPDHCPTILFPCGHSFCSQCCKLLLKKHGNRKCPECRAKINSHAVNIPLKQIIESYVEKERELKDKERQQRQSHSGTDLHFDSRNMSPHQSQQHEDLQIDNKMDSVMNSILSNLSGHEQVTAKKYYNDYKKFSLRSQLLKLELKEVQDELKSLDKKEEKTKHHIKSVQKEEEAIRKDIEMLMQGLEELQQQLRGCLDDEQHVQVQRKESAKKIEMIDSTIQSVESQKEKSIVLLSKFVPNARRLQFE